MLKFLNNMFGEQGLEFLDIIITKIDLTRDIEDLLDQKAQFESFMITDREQFNYDMRIINDKEELALISQRRYEQRDSI